MTEQGLPPHDTETASRRREAFLAALPPSLARAEDDLPREIKALNASARSKLSRINVVADELSKVREPFVACAKGCASCCHMNVSITTSEATRLAKASGRRMASVTQTRRHPVAKFAGRPCPFLGGEGLCSVYVDRPLACRKHASFFLDSKLCHPSVMNEVSVPQVGFSGLDEAFVAVAAERGDVLADIRDFFAPSAD